MLISLEPTFHEIARLRAQVNDLMEYSTTEFTHLKSAHERLCIAQEALYCYSRGGPDKVPARERAQRLINSVAARIDRLRDRIDAPPEAAVHQ